MHRIMVKQNGIMGVPHTHIHTGRWKPERCGGGFALGKLMERNGLLSEGFTFPFSIGTNYSLLAKCGILSMRRFITLFKLEQHSNFKIEALFLKKNSKTNEPSSNARSSKGVLTQLRMNQLRSNGYGSKTNPARGTAVLSIWSEMRCIICKLFSSSLISVLHPFNGESLRFAYCASSGVERGKVAAQLK